MHDKPRLLDLFCGAGGAAMGYHRAGFDVVGVDIKPQKNYPFPFVQDDALEYVLAHGKEYDVMHASPPCQYYSRLRHLPWIKDKVYWRSIPPTREVLLTVGKPYVIENVADAWWDMVNPTLICCATFDLHLYHHRLFETSIPVFAHPHTKHTFVITPGRASLGKRRHGFGKSEPWCEWMTKKERGQAVHPIQTEFIGKQLLQVVNHAR